MFMVQKFVWFIQLAWLEIIRVIAMISMIPYKKKIKIFHDMINHMVVCVCIYTHTPANKSHDLWFVENWLLIIIKCKFHHLTWINPLIFDFRFFLKFVRVISMNSNYVFVFVFTCVDKLVIPIRLLRSNVISFIHVIFFSSSSFYYIVTRK